MARMINLNLTTEQLGWIVDVLDASPRSQENSELMCVLCDELSKAEDLEMQDREDDDYRARGSDDMSDDAEVLASAGMGTDEDYGYYGGEE